MTDPVTPMAAAGAASQDPGLDPAFCLCVTQAGFQCSRRPVKGMSVCVQHSRKKAPASPLPPPTHSAYILLSPETRSFYVISAADWAKKRYAGYRTADDLPPSVTDERLCEFLRLIAADDAARYRYESERGSVTPESPEFIASCTSTPLTPEDYRRFQEHYEWALAERAKIESTYGKAAAEARAAYKAAKASLVLDLFGPSSEAG